MIKYLLDTNAVIALINEPQGPVAMQARSHPAHAVAVSSIVMHELFFGAYKSQRVSRNVQTVDSLRARIRKLEGADD